MAAGGLHQRKGLEFAVVGDGRDHPRILSEQRVENRLGRNQAALLDDRVSGHRLLGPKGVVLTAARGVVDHGAGAAVGVRETGHRRIGRAGRRVIDEPHEPPVGQDDPEHFVARGKVHVAARDLRVPPAVHVAPKPHVVGDHEIGRVDAAHPRRETIELLARDALHRAGRGIDDHHRGHFFTAPPDRRPSERDQIARVSFGVDLQRRLQQQFGAVLQPDVAAEIVVQEGGWDVAQRGALAQFGRRVGILRIDDHDAG